MKKLIIKLIELYQITPLHSHSNCRFIPSCSEYAKMAIKEYGVLKGSILALKRIIKCHPFGKYGIDNIPKKKE